MKATQSTILTALVAVLLSPLVSAHFLLNDPPSRGFDDDKIVTFPCGSFDTVQTTRASFPISGGAIALTMADKATNIEVLIGYGDTVGSNFNTVIRRTFSQTGAGSFCMTGFDLPANMDGMNATIQVVTSDDETGGGLYNCADVTLSATAAAALPAACTNGTGISTGVSTITGNPNVTLSTMSNSTHLASSGTRAAHLSLLAIIPSIGVLLQW